MKYYAFIEGSQQGPFDLRELVEAGVRPSTYIWCKGMDDWHRADEVPEVCDMFREHLESHPPRQPEIVIPSDRNQGENYPGKEEAPEEGPDLSDIPQSYRYFVRKSRTTPGPSNSMEPDTGQPPQVSMTLAVISLLLCFPPTGIAAVIFTYKAQKEWGKALKAQSHEDAESLRKAAHEYARQSKMWLGITVALGLIFWSFVFSVKK